MNNKIIKFLSTLKNASLVKKEFVAVPYYTIVLSCTESLYKEGLIQSYTLAGNKTNKVIVIRLRVVNDFCLTSNIKLISKSVYTKYLTYKDIVRLVIKQKDCFFLTSKGIRSLKDCKASKIGGVLMFSC
jgi:small subunit ribosomal protein S8